MNHTVLARKWRPKKFADLVGQKNTVTILQNIISSERLHHAYLLTGTRGVGKTTIARIIAKALNCLAPIDNEPCGQCEHCQQIDSGRLVDVIEIDAASNTGVDNIREVLENAQYAPTSGKYKIYIIDEVHMLSKSAFNAMLKTLEEPPAHVVFILATTDPHKVPITVLSRCLQLKLRNLSAPEIENYLGKILQLELIGFENPALSVIATAANGSMRDALSLTDQAIAFSNGHITLEVSQQMLGISDDGSIIAILQAITQTNSPQLVEICKKLNEEGSNLENILEQLNLTLFNIGLAQLSPQSDLSPELMLLAQQISLQDCQLYFEISNLGLEQIRKVNNKYPVFTMCLLRMIAFTIGSNEQKTIVVNSNNCNSTIVTSQPQINHNEITNKKMVPTETIIEDHNDEIEVTTQIIQNNIEEIDIPPWEEVPEETLVVADKKIVPIIDTHEIPQFNGNWLDFVSTLNYETIDPSIAVVLRNSSQIKSNEAAEISLLINDTFRSLVTPQCVDNIENLLWHTYQQHYDLNFNFSKEVKDGSLRQLEVTKAEQLQLQAEQSIKEDPVIQDLVNNFSAKILPNSIKPL